MSNVFAGFPPRRFAVRVVFHSRRRPYRRDGGKRDGIVLLSSAWNRRQKKCGGGNLAINEFDRNRLNPKTDAENAVENQPVDTDCKET
jgi:hypothetical protein